MVRQLGCVAHGVIKAKSASGSDGTIVQSGRWRIGLRSHVIV